MKSRIATGTLAVVAGMAIGWFAAPTEKTSVSSDKPGSGQVFRKLVEAGEIIDPEQRVLAVRRLLRTPMLLNWNLWQTRSRNSPSEDQT